MRKVRCMMPSVNVVTHGECELSSSKLADAGQNMSSMNLHVTMDVGCPSATDVPAGTRTRSAPQTLLTLGHCYVAKDAQSSFFDR